MRRRLPQFLIVAACIGISFAVFRSPGFQGVVAWSQRNLFLFLGVLLVLKCLSNLLPFVPAGFITFAAIPLVGWFPAFLVNLVGGLAGASAAYWLGYRYKAPILRQVFGESAEQRLLAFKVRPDRSLEAVFIIRLLTSQFSQLFSYGASWLGVPFSTYLLGTAGAGIVGILLFLAGGSLSGGGGLGGTVAALAVLALFMGLLRKRYFAAVAGLDRPKGADQADSASHSPGRPLQDCPEPADGTVRTASDDRSESPGR